MDEQAALAVFDDFVNGRLHKDAWTHEAHLITCWVALQDRTPAETLAFLRDAIQTHNCGIGIRNTDISGYHETLTVYYVTAVAEAASPTIEELFEIPSCDRKAALDHWSREVLFGTEARLGWVEPDIAALPWEPKFDAAPAGTLS
jgi:hypothetical protein